MRAYVPTNPSKAYPTPAELFARVPGEMGLGEREGWAAIAAGARTFLAALTRLRRKEPHLTLDQAKDRLWQRIGL